MTMLVFGLSLILSVLFIQSNAQPIVSHHDEYHEKQRHLTVRRKTKPVETGLVVRILVPQGGGYRGSFASSNELYNIAFGPTNSAKSQFRDCSGGQLDFQPYGSGVIEVKVTRAVNHYTRDTLRAEATNGVCNYLGRANGCGLHTLGIDHIMFVAPHGVSNDDPGGLGYLFASVGGQWSMYGDSWKYSTGAFSVEGIGHELAHNWGVAHSNDGSGQDNSNLMGGSFYLFPAGSTGDHRCYNAFTYQLLGWHQDKFVAIPQGESRVLQIGGLAQKHLLKNEHTLFVQYGNFYISYNLAIGFMDGLKEHQDRLLIVQPQNTDYATTHAKAALGVGQVYSSGSFRVEVCSDQWAGGLQTMTVAVGANAKCGAPPTAPPTPSPTASPTDPPTPAPTDNPTEAPTPEPSASPTTAPPTNEPTPEPTSSPTSAHPTDEPTLSPTFPPTLAPTPSPTNSPSLQPTPRPTTTHPTLAPTLAPTPVPTSRPTRPPPTHQPTRAPTFPPTRSPTPNPITTRTDSAPTLSPTRSPTASPTPVPTLPPVVPQGPPSSPPIFLPFGSQSEEKVSANEESQEVASVSQTFQTCTETCSGDKVRMCLVWESGRQREVCVSERVFELQSLSKPQSFCGACGVPGAEASDNGLPECPEDGCGRGRIRVCMPPRRRGLPRTSCIRSRHWARIFVRRPGSTCGACESDSF